MLKPCSISLFSLILLAGCAGHLPEPGRQEALPPSDIGRTPQARVGHDPPSGNPAVDAARDAAVVALQACDAVLLAIPNQQLTIKRIAYNRKQGGVLATTIVGVAGSIVTAVLSSSSQVDDRTVTIAGASTAGATAIAGVGSLFIVGSGADERVALLSQYAEQVGDAETTFKSQCDQVGEESAATCTAEALRLKNQCKTVEGQLPYTIPRGIELRK